VNILEFTMAIGVISLFAGFLGALTGLGGGTVLVPVLTLIFGIDIRYAIGASLVSVIATSSGSAAAYLKEGFTNIRVGMFLEVATTFGALIGVFLATKLSNSLIAVIFGIVLLGSSYWSSRSRTDHQSDDNPNPLATRLKLNGNYPTPEGHQIYWVQNVSIGFGLMMLSGTLSSLLGIGSGAVKVLAMDQAMHLPFKVSTTTSNFMIGVTAATGAGVYLNRGYIDPGLSMPVMLGVLLGSVLGARTLVRTNPNVLRKVFSVIILLLATEMIINGITGRI
jgi:uncharacterized membrane protein YfcA